MLRRVAGEEGFASFDIDADRVPAGVRRGPHPPLAPDGAYPTHAAFVDQIDRSYRVGIRGDFGGND